MTSQVSFSKKINGLTNIFLQRKSMAHKYLFPKKSTTSQISFYLFPKNQLPHKYIFPKKSTTSQISVSKKIKNHTNIFFPKKSKTSKVSFSRKKSKAIYPCTMYNVLSKKKRFKTLVFKLPSFDCYETGGSFQLCVYSIFCQTSHKTSLKFLLFSKKSQPQIICFEEKQLKTTIENVFVFLCKLFIREKKYF